MKTPDIPKRVLVVEDEPAIGNLARRVLSLEGFEVDIAVNGIEAQDMVTKKQYDLCLIDLRTPKMNGKELYQWLKQEKPELVKGIIFTTGDVMLENNDASLHETGRRLLPKPFSTSQLLSVVEEVLKEVGR